MIKRLIISRTSQRIIDLCVLSVAFWLGFVFRFDADIPIQYLKRSFFLWPYVVGLQYLTLAFLGVPRFSWRYVGLREVTREKDADWIRENHGLDITGGQASADPLLIVADGGI